MDEQYSVYRQLIEQYLQTAFVSAGDAADGLREAMRYSLLAGGKRVRPVLCLEFCRLCGGDIMSAVPVAAGIEMLHTYSLIHDDLPCMDNDDMRRGMPTNHKKFGECTAVLAGDCLQAEAFSAVCSAEIGEAGKFRCCRILSRAAGIGGICGGQFMDIFPEEVTADTLSMTDLYKTAVLIGAACAMGAAAAGVSDETIDRAEAFGLALGMAFQCRDDLLDGDGFCGLLGREKCEKLTDMYTQQALEYLSYFADTNFLQALTMYLAGRTA